MPSFRENRIALLYAYDDEVINDEEFVLLYDANTSKNLDCFVFMVTLPTLYASNCRLHLGELK